MNYSDPFGLCDPMPACLLDFSRLYRELGLSTKIPFYSHPAESKFVIGVSGTVTNVSTSATVGAVKGTGTSIALNTPSYGGSVDVGVKYSDAKPGEVTGAVSAGVSRHFGVTVTNETIMLNVGLSTPAVSPITVSVDVPTQPQPRIVVVPPIRPDVTAVTPDHPE